MLLICLDDQSLKIGKVSCKIDRIYYLEHSLFFNRQVMALHG